MVHVESLYQSSSRRKNPYGLLNGLLRTPKPGPVEEILTLKQQTFTTEVFFC